MDVACLSAGRKTLAYANRRWAISNDVRYVLAASPYSRHVTVAVNAMEQIALRIVYIDVGTAGSWRSETQIER
jgi:hypothetical protein